VRVVDALFSAVLAVALGVWLDTPAAEATGRPVHLATGVTYEAIDLAEMIDQPEGRDLAHLVRVDRPEAPVALWANSPEAPGNDHPYRAQPVWRFAKEAGLLVTINANRFGPAWPRQGWYRVGQPADSAFTLGPDPAWPLSADGPHNPVLLIHNDGRAVMHRRYRALNDLPPDKRPAARFAVLGDGLVWNGAPAPHLARDRHPARPRTAIAISADGWTLWLAVFEQATRRDVARALVNRGAHSALLLDGGGSSSMVIRSPRIGDDPGGLVHPALRPVATVLGLRWKAPER